MTTVLKAVRELEKRGAPVQRPATSPMDAEPRLRWSFALTPLVLAAVTGGVVFFWTRYAPHSSPSTSAPAVVEPRVAAEPPAHGPQLRAIPAQKDAPWGRVEKRRAAAPEVGQPAAPAPVAAARVAPAAAPAPRALAAAPPAAPAQATKSRREPPAVADRAPETQHPRAASDMQDTALTAPGTEAASRDTEATALGSDATVPDRAPPAPDSEGRAISSGADMPRVQVVSIAYSPDMAKRAVSLRINGAQAVKLHEGESTNGVEVQLIGRDSVYLRHGGNVFAVAVD